MSSARVRRRVASVITGQHTWLPLSMEYRFPAYHLTNLLEPPTTVHPPPESPVGELTAQPEAEPRGRKRVSRWSADRRLLLGLSLLLLVAVTALYYPVRAYPFNAIN